MSDTSPAKIVTRFAPSPTGFLHIGGVRTALFNWLFARHHGGTYLLRIEDTDRERSTDAAIEAILDGLAWMGLSGDEPPVFQFSRAARHAAVAQELLDAGRAYHCHATPEELQQMREAAKAAGRSMRYDGRWRDRAPSEAPAGAKPVVRLKAPQDGETVVTDLIQGEVRVANSELDDMVLLRSDGTPTYMLSVVVDDHDMGVSHVIRGDDHLTNTFRQLQIYEAMGWTPPAFAHMSLIHGPDGAKLSKRHGALGVEAYRDMGLLPEAMFNYLLRLGWSHGDDEIISREQAIQWFGLESVGKAPARFDLAKLSNLNAHYIKEADDRHLIELITPRLAAALGAPPSPESLERLKRGLSGLKPRAQTLVELADKAMIYVAARPLVPDAKAAKLLAGPGRDHLAKLLPTLDGLKDWQAAILEPAVKGYAGDAGAKLGEVAQPLRAALTGRAESPGLFEVMEALGRDESLGRIRDAAGPDNT